MSVEKICETCDKAINFCLKFGCKVIVIVSSADAGWQAAMHVEEQSKPVIPIVQPSVKK